MTLPCKLPLLLMLGADGIAVGLSTRILPHNFIELLEAEIAILRKKPFEVMPDFQQGGLMDVSEYERGEGKIRLRAVIEPKPKKDHILVIREVPYGVTTDSLISSIEDAARKKKLNIKSIHDFTAEQIEVEIHLPPDAKVEKTVQALYAFTQCEMSLSSRLVVIRGGKPVEMTVNEVLKENVRQLRGILERELKLERKRLLDEVHRKTLVQIFVENRIYKRIEECETADQVVQEVLDGVNEFRSLLRRDVTLQDVEMLLSIPIKRISRYDMKKNRKEIGDLLSQLDEVEKSLGQLTRYAVRYLQRLIKKYKNEYPRRTKIESFGQVEKRQLAARDLVICRDEDKGYIGHDVKGEELFTCTTLDRIVVVYNDGRYKVVNPPDKFYVGDEVIYCARMERDRIMTLIYTHEGITYMKRFTFGGAILNKDYTCAPAGSGILLFADDEPAQVYVKYRKEKRQRIHQQVFHTGKLPVKTVKAKGAQMTVKKIRLLSTSKPRGWNDADGMPHGAYIDF